MEKVNVTGLWLRGDYGVGGSDLSRRESPELFLTKAEAEKEWEALEYLAVRYREAADELKKVIDG